jgi:exosortase
VGLAALAGWTVWHVSLSANDHLTLLVLAYVLFIAAGGFLFLGSAWMRAAAFPMAFLLFMVPLPDAAVYWIERGLVLASADASAFLFNLTGTPMYREGTILALPGIVLEVAQECSGIRSTWILFITSVLASQLFLQSPWRRVLLVAFIIPLGIVRNGFRILTIGLLCVHVGPHMIDSVIHHRGGPIFFALSLIPLFLLLVWLRRGDRGRAAPEGGLRPRARLRREGGFAEGRLRGRGRRSGVAGPPSVSEANARRAILRLMRPVDALYENGLLRPVSPLPLRSGERVAVIVVRRPDASRWDVARLAAHANDDLALAQAGLDEWAAALDREDRG